MSDPEKPTMERDTDPGAELLRAARSYRLSEETRKRAFAAAGIGVGVTAAATGKAVAEGTLAGAKTLWWVVGGLTGVVIAGTGYLLFAPESGAPASGVPSATVAAPMAAPAAPPATAPVEAATPPEASSAPDELQAPAVVSVPRSSALPDLQAEVAALDAARQALAQGDGARSLALINAYQQKFPRGSLGIEASVLRIDALQRAGRNAEAKQRARAFVRRFPKSPQAERVRRIAGE
jgi:TolA-binding protein